MNIQELIKNAKGMDKKIIKIMKTGICCSFIFCIIASMILFTYNINNNPNMFYIGISLLKSSLFFIVGFIVCGFAFNNIMKEI